jgi:hypothetical protein
MTVNQYYENPVDSEKTWNTVMTNNIPYSATGYNKT